MLAKDAPDVDFTLALGADTFIDLASGKWRRTEDVFALTDYRMVVFPRIREGSEGDGINSLTGDSVDPVLQESIAKWQPAGDQPSIRVVRVPVLSSISSSAVRRSMDEKFLSEALSSEVLQYIRRHRMYAIYEKTKIGVAS